MPAMSKKQFRFMAAIAHGAKMKKKAGISEEKAKEYISHNKGEAEYSKLPEETSKKKRRFKAFGK